MFAVTGASGRLGRLVVDALLTRVDPAQIVALARDPGKLAPLAARGVAVRAFDYDEPETLWPALTGVARLLLISSSDMGGRERQHRAVLDAAKQAGVKFVGYTSILHADSNPMGLADEHRATEAAIRESGIPHAMLRHGWYTENYTASARDQIARGTVIGSAGMGRVSTAACADYAAADAAVLTGTPAPHQVFELAGDDAFTLAEYAAALGAASVRNVAYVDTPEAAYRAALIGAGLPPHLAALLADSSARTADDVLFDDGRALSTLIGRPTTPMEMTLQATLR